jgi:hypothetical protein
MDVIMTTWILRPVCRVVPLALVILCAVPPVARAAQSTPSLVDMARQEQARRKALKLPSKVYSDKDIPHPVPASPPAAGRTASGPDASAVPDSPVPAGTPAASADSDTHDQKWWHDRMERAREDLRRSEVFVEALQSRINGLTADFVNRDDPYQRAKIGDDRQKMLAELDRVKSDVEKAKKVITEIEDDARRAGVPSGWVR